MHIAVCSNDGKHCKSLIVENVERPRSIALYPQEGRMYWSEWGQEPMIGVAHMDGTFKSLTENCKRERHSMRFVDQLRYISRTIYSRWHSMAKWHYIGLAEQSFVLGGC